MPNSCVIVGCTNREGKDGIRMFRIPAIRHNKGDRVKDLTAKRRQEWIRAINRKHITTDSIRVYHKVCSEHFNKGKPADLLDDTNPDWIPHLKLGYGEDEPSKRHYERLQQRRLREKERGAAEALLQLQPLSTNNEMEVEDQLTKEVSTQSDLTISDMDAEASAFNGMVGEITSLRSRLDSVCFDESKFIGNDEKTNYYTGIGSAETFLALITYISPAIVEGRNSLTKFQEILLVLMKLRLALPTRLLGDLFNVDQTTVSRIFLRIINIMYHNMKFLIVWPERDILKNTMPLEFTKYFEGRVTVIIDCFEIFIERPNNLKARAETYSHYKGTNTIKYLIGITPQGVISYISEGWGGRTSDKHIVEHSGFLSKLEFGDVVLADRGFNTHESMNLMQAELKIPAFTKGKNQLSPYEVESTRKIAHLRIHVERVIGSMRNKFTLIQNRIPLDYLITADEDFNTLDQVVTVCSGLNNLNSSVVPFS